MAQRFKAMQSTHIYKARLGGPLSIKRHNAAITSLEETLGGFKMSEKEQKDQYTQFQAKTDELSRHFSDQQTLTKSGFRQAESLYKAMEGKNEAYQKAMAKKEQMGDPLSQSTQAKGIKFLDEALKATKMCEEELESRRKVLKDLKGRREAGEDT